MSDDVAFALIMPNGEVTWYPLGDEDIVEARVAGRVAHAIDREFLVPGEPLRLIGSDVALAAPGEFEPNPAAQRIITALSRGRITQEWRGHVAIAEYEQDTETREWLWPGVMSEQVQQRIRQAVTAAGARFSKSTVMKPHRDGDAYLVGRWPVPDTGTRRFTHPRQVARFLRELPVGSSSEIIHVRDGGATEVARYWPMTVIDAVGVTDASG